MAYKRISPQPVIEGGTGAQTFGLNGVLIGNTTSAITATTAGTTGQVLTGVTGSAPTFQSPASSSITITGDSGGGLTGTSFTFTGASTGLTFAGAGSTETLGGTLIVGNGGTGVSTMTTAYAPVCAGTTATGSLQVASTGLSTSGYVLTSTGASSLPAFQNIATTGTFNPSLTFGGGTSGITYNSRYGKYWVIGPIVYFGIFFALTSKGSSTGTAYISNLPFTSANDSTYGISTCSSSDIAFGTLNTALTGFVITNSTQMYFQSYGGGAAVGATNLDNTYFTNSSQFYCNGFYWTS